MKNLYKKLFGVIILFQLIFSVTAQSQTALFAVIQNGKTGYMDKAGKLIVPCQYDPLDFFSFPQFSNGLIGFKQNGKWGMLDVQGKVVIQPLYKNTIYFLQSDYSAVRIKKEGEKDETLLEILSNSKPYSIIDKKGNPALPGEYTLPPWSKGIKGDLLIHKKDNLVTFTNIRTKQPAGKSFYSLGEFKNGRAQAQEVKDGKYGQIDQKGNWIIRPEYDDIQVEENGLLQVSMEDGDAKWALMDKSMNIVAGPFTQYKRAYAAGGYPSFSKEGLLPVQEKATGLYGCINAAGKLIIACKYNEAVNFSEGIAMVNEGGIKEPGKYSGFVYINPQWKAIDARGNVLFTLTGCAKAFGFFEGGCQAWMGDTQVPGEWKRGLIDKKGNFIVPAQSKVTYNNFKNGLCLFESEKGFGYYDLTGKVIWQASK